MKATAYLVLHKHRNSLSVRRVTQRPGSLDVGEARIKVEVEVPDDLFDSPVVTVKATLKKNAAVAVEDPE